MIYNIISQRAFEPSTKQYLIEGLIILEGWEILVQINEGQGIKFFTPCVTLEGLELAHQCLPLSFLTVGSRCSVLSRKYATQPATKGSDEKGTFTILLNHLAPVCHTSAFDQTSSFSQIIFGLHICILGFRSSIQAILKQERAEAVGECYCIWLEV